MLLVVEFEDFVFPSEVSIYETYNPGAVVKLWAFTIDEKWICLWESDKNNDNSLRRQMDSVQLVNDSHIFSPSIKEIKIPTRIIRIEFNHRNLDYFTEIDGVVLDGIKYTPRGDLQHLMNVLQTNKGPIQRKLEKVSFTTVSTANQIQAQRLKDFLIKDLEHFIAEINCNDRGLRSNVPDASDKNPYTLKNMPVSIIRDILAYFNTQFNYDDFIRSFLVGDFTKNLFLFGFGVTVSYVTNLSKISSSSQ